MTTNSHEWAVNVFINDYSWTFMAIHVIIFSWLLLFIMVERRFRMVILQRVKQLKTEN